MAPATKPDYPLPSQNIMARQIGGPFSCLRPTCESPLTVVKLTCQENSVRHDTEQWSTERADRRCRLLPPAKSHENRSARQGEESTMNPITATMRSTDLCALLGVSDQSIFRWMARPYPPFHDFRCAPRGKMFALPETVARLRARRRGGLVGDDLSRVVGFDARVRAERARQGADELWLGDDPESRAAAFRAALKGEEEERARSVQKAVTSAAMAAGVPRVERLRRITLIHPACVRFILTGEAEELPVGDAGWAAWIRAVDVVNIPAAEERVAA